MQREQGRGMVRVTMSNWVRSTAILAGVMIALSICYGIGCYFNQRAKSTAQQEEQARACQALTQMGGGGSAYVICCDADGPYNEIELAPRGDRVNDDSLRNLAGLTAVVGLNLSGNRLTDAGLVHIKGLTSLVYLQLAETDVTDRGLKDLAGLPNLEALDLVGTRVTQAGAQSLEKLPKLKTVYALGTSLTSVRGVEVDRSNASHPWASLDYRPDILRGPLSARRRASEGRRWGEPWTHSGRDPGARSQ